LIVVYLSEIRCIRPQNWLPVRVDSLEPSADKVVRSNSHYSVIAGPGAGKTELLAQRACYLLQTNQCPHPRKILAISFKKDAAENLKQRVLERCNNENMLRFDSLTFDAFSKHLLDRFLNGLPEFLKPTKDYKIYSPQRSEFPNFLSRLADDSANAYIKSKLLKIEGDSFEKNYILGSPLPIQRGKTSCVGFWAAMKWWNTCLHVGVESQLTFPMIGRLVELILRTNPYICRSLQATYAYVFMDEFQDTTHVQYDLVKTAFLGSQTVLTAVGDNKQQIMRWAMALGDAFGDFERDFGAKRIQITRNYRSSTQLVEIQHYLARTIDPNSKKSVAQKSLSIQDESCIILEFINREREAEYLAQYISQNIQSSKLSPRDFALLVKQKADDHAKLFKPIFQESPHNLKLRCEAELQDILAENLTRILITFLRFGSKDQAGAYWTDCLNVMKYLRGIDSEDKRIMKSIQTELNEFHSMLKEYMGIWNRHEIQVKLLLEKIIYFLGKENIERSYAGYKQQDRCKEIVKKVSTHLAQSCDAIVGNNWNNALDSFEGKDSIPILTIHKSKGLEYHTVIFVGFDDKDWWNFAQQPEESRSAFFVAFSRAKQRIIFTYCKQRGEKKKIASLYQVLSEAGVKTKYII
jgi:superfamily I DNA/RNA helicase